MGRIMANKNIFKDGLIFLIEMFPLNALFNIAFAFYKKNTLFEKNEFIFKKYINLIEPTKLRDIFWPYSQCLYSFRYICLHFILAQIYCCVVTL